MDGRYFSKISLELNPKESEGEVDRQAHGDEGLLPMLRTKVTPEVKLKLCP